MINLLMWSNFGTSAIFITVIVSLGNLLAIEVMFFLFYFHSSAFFSSLYTSFVGRIIHYVLSVRVVLFLRFFEIKSAHLV